MNYIIVAVDGYGRTLRAEAIQAGSITEAEERAIAMKTTVKGTKYIISDSMTGIMAYAAGYTSRMTLRKLERPQE